jgi:hypothetical protein
MRLMLRHALSFVALFRSSFSSHAQPLCRRAVCIVSSWMGECGPCTTLSLAGSKVH